MLKIIAGALAALSISGAANAAGYAVVDVAGTAMPWFWDVDAGLNDDYHFGVQDGSGPTVFDLAAFGIHEGDAYGFLFIDGLTSAFVDVPPGVDNGGYQGSAFANDVPGSSGEYLPSFYMTDDWGVDTDPMTMMVTGYRDVYLNALVGAFTNQSGQVFSPFSLGTTFSDADHNANGLLVGFSSLLGAGITHVQFGLNDDQFFDNSGSLRVCIDHADNACRDAFFPQSGGAVPEPATWAMMIAGFGLSGAMLRRRRTLVV